MAKYEDYARAQNLDDEIDEAAANQRARDEKGRFIPDRFKDKDIVDVIKSYEELEKLNSRQAQDLGQMRKTVDQLLEIQQQASSPAPEPSKPVSVDDLYEDADGNIRRVVREETSNEVKGLREELDLLRMERKYAELEKKFPDWQSRVKQEGFREWVQGSPYRLRMYQEADNGDFDAAEAILGLYYETSSEAEEDTSEQNREQEVQRQLKDAMLESGSPAPTELVDTYSRYDLLEKRIAAKRGDLKAERWLQAHASSISQAYAEGRIVD